MTVARQRLGRLAEELVARELERQGWRIVARNARPSGIRGELDIIAVEAGELVVVEVKAGRLGARAGPVTPLEMVGRQKQARLRVLSAAWAREHRAELPALRGIRIDVVAVRLDGAGNVADWQHVRAAC